MKRPWFLGEKEEEKRSASASADTAKDPPGSQSSPNLQRSLGNQAVQDLVRSERSGSDELSPVVREGLKTPGKPLPPSVARQMGVRLNSDLSEVRIHDDSKASASAEALGALAYTYGNDIVVRNGSADPQTSTGKRVLAHELTHVIQQSRGGNTSVGGLEREAKRSETGSAGPAVGGTKPTLLLQEASEQVVRRLNNSRRTAGLDSAVVIRRGDAWFMRGERDGAAYEVEMHNVPHGAHPSFQVTEHNYLIVWMTGDTRRGYWMRVDEDARKFEYYDQLSTSRRDLRTSAPQVLTDEPGVRETVGSTGAHYTRLSRGDYSFTFRHDPGSGAVTFVLTNSAAGRFTPQFTLTFAQNRVFRPRIIGTTDERAVISLDNTTTGDVYVATRTHSGRDSMPYYENYRVILRSGRWSYEEIVIVGNGMGVWTERWHTAPTDPNFIQEPHWHMFSTGYQAGWRRGHMWIPMSIYGTNVRGARVTEMLFEQSARGYILSIPIVGNLVMIGEAVAGREIITGEHMGDNERLLHGALGGLFLIIEGAVIAQEVRGAAAPAVTAADDAAELEARQVATAMRGGMSEAEARAFVRALGELDEGELAFLRQVEEDLAAGRALTSEQSERVGQILGRLDQEARASRMAVLQEAGEVGEYTTEIRWGIHDIEARPHPSIEGGYWGERLPQADARVNAFELKVNPNNESFYLRHPEGGFVQFENVVGSATQDGKLVMSQRSIYHVQDLPSFARRSVLAEARRQVAAASNAGLSVEWLVSESRALQQLRELFQSEGVNIRLTLFPE